MCMRMRPPNYSSLSHLHLDPVPTNPQEGLKDPLIARLHAISQRYRYGASPGLALCMNVALPPWKLLANNSMLLRTVPCTFMKCDSHVWCLHSRTFVCCYASYVFSYSAWRVICDQFQDWCVKMGSKHTIFGLFTGNQQIGLTRPGGGPLCAASCPFVVRCLSSIIVC